MLLTISEVSELSASSTVGLWRSDADVFNGEEFPENAIIQNEMLDCGKYGLSYVFYVLHI